MNALAWIGAIGGLLGAASWLGTIRARWELRTESLRGSRAQQENQLHRQRFAEAWHAWHDLPDSPQRAAALQWYGQWTAARDPANPTAPGPQIPGTGCRTEDDACQRYLDHLDARYNPTGRFAPQIPATIPGE